MSIDATVGPVPASAAAVAFWLSFALAATLSPSPAAAQGLALTTVEVADGLVLPVGVAHAGDGSGRLFVVQQTGQIVIWDGSQVLAEPFLDLAGAVTCCGERGLLGLAFHPQYATNGRFFVNYTRTVDGQLETVVARYTVSADDPDLADPASAVVLLTYDQPFTNHNGGQAAFGPDGYLYVSSGDGGSGGDPQENAQALDTPLGKVLRIDVDGADPGLAYAIPPSNPFAASPVRAARSGPTGCATPGASPSTAAPATCGSPTSARRAGRRSTGSRRPAPAARTTAGTAARVSTPSTTPTAT